MNDRDNFERLEILQASLPMKSCFGNNQIGVGFNVTIVEYIKIQINIKFAETTDLNESALKSRPNTT